MGDRAQTRSILSLIWADCLLQYLLLPEDGLFRNTRKLCSRNCLTNDLISILITSFFNRMCCQVEVWRERDRTVRTGFGFCNRKIYVKHYTPSMSSRLGCFVTFEPWSGSFQPTQQPEQIDGICSTWQQAPLKIACQNRQYGLGLWCISVFRWRCWTDRPASVFHLFTRDSINVTVVVCGIQHRRNTLDR